MGSNHDLVAVLVGGGLVCLLGVVDDVWGLDPFTKPGRAGAGRRHHGRAGRAGCCRSRCRAP
nr:hypothetical protein [Angustibacter aerolatus]